MGLLMKREVRGEIVSVVSTATARLQQVPVQNIFILPFRRLTIIFWPFPPMPLPKGVGDWALPGSL